MQPTGVRCVAANGRTRLQRQVTVVSRVTVPYTMSMLHPRNICLFAEPNVTMYSTYILGQRIIYDVDSTL
jgi:hypothetical protein